MKMVFINKEKEKVVDLTYEDVVLSTHKFYYGNDLKKNKERSLCRIILKESLNNFYINVIGEKGETLLSKSAGLRNKHRLRTSPQTVEEMVNELILEMHLKMVMSQNGFILSLKSPLNAKMKNVVRLFTLSKIKIVAFLNKTQIPHNGIRGRKRRRK